MKEALESSVYDHLYPQPSDKLAEVHFLTLSIAAYKFLHENSDIPKPIDETNFPMNNAPDIYEETGTKRNWVSLADNHPDKKYHILSGALTEKMEEAVRSFLEALEKLETKYQNG